MKRAAVTHVGFSDESNWNTGRFRSLGLVTCALSSLKDLEAQLGNLLRESNVSEFKWKWLESARERFAAEKMCRLAVEEAYARRLRVDVLVWDIQDSRHSIPGRDDIANLQRMYYHLFRNVLRARWPNDAVWRLHPDEHTAINWETVQDVLMTAALRVEEVGFSSEAGLFRLKLRRDFGLEQIMPVSSKEHPLLQLADLFAGLAVFSREQFHEYQRWLSVHGGQRVPCEEESVELPRRMQERFRVLRKFDCLCKNYKMGVSLKTKKGLWTPKPENPINFWIYEPQHPDDKAPRRVNK